MNLVGTRIVLRSTYFVCNQALWPRTCIFKLCLPKANPGMKIFILATLFLSSVKHFLAIQEDALYFFSNCYLTRHFDTARNFVFSFFICFALFSNATEVDPYTYRHIPLADESRTINWAIQSQIDKNIANVNKEIQQKLADGNPMNDRSIERLFSKYFVQEKLPIYYNFFDWLFNPEKFIISKIENCIYYNNCSGWPFIERIVLQGQESIYARAKYNTVTQIYLAATINLCGYRIGADKLTHFLGEGFSYHNLWMNNYTEEDIDKLQIAVESSSNGSSFTGVFSYADLAAEKSGMLFYYNLFLSANPFIKKGPSGHLVRVRPIDICAFVNRSWDEYINKSNYTQANANRLLATINDELSSPSPIDRSILLHRPVTAPTSFQRLSALQDLKNTPQGIDASYEIFSNGTCFIFNPKCRSKSIVIQTIK